MNPTVVVIGGGPAGLAAALALGGAGIATLVCERSAFPVDKACGEGLLENAVAALAHFGVARAELERAGRGLAGVRYASLGGRRAEATVPSGSAFGLRRTALSALLLARARSLPAVEVAAGVTARLELKQRSRPEVWIGGERLRPRLVIGADGLSSRIRRKIGLATRFVSPRRFGARRHFAIEPWTSHVEVYFGRGAEAYVTPLLDGVNVALLWEPDAMGLERGTAPFSALLAQFPALAARLRAAPSEERVRASGPFHQEVEERATDGVLLVGDAAGYVDALTGEGVGLALAQAAALERSLVPALVTGGVSALSAGELEPSRRAIAAVCGPNRRFTRFLLALARRPALFDRAVALLAEDPALFRHFVAASAGARAPLRLPLASALRLPRSMLGVLRREPPETTHALRNTT